MVLGIVLTVVFCATGMFALFVAGVAYHKGDVTNAVFAGFVGFIMLGVLIGVMSYSLESYRPGQPADSLEPGEYLVVRTWHTSTSQYFVLQEVQYVKGDPKHIADEKNPRLVRLAHDKIDSLLPQEERFYRVTLVTICSEENHCTTKYHFEVHKYSNPRLAPRVFSIRLVSRTLSRSLAN